MKRINDARRQRLLKLKEENPEKFKEITGKIRNRVNDRLAKLKAENPRNMNALCSRGKN